MHKFFVLGCLLFLHKSVGAQEKARADSVFVCPPCGAACDDTAFLSPGICSHCRMPLVKGVPNKLLKVAKNPTICFYLQDGVEVLDFAGPLEIFSYAGFSVFTVSNQKQIRSQGLLTVLPDYQLENAPSFDVLAVFGGNASRVYKDSTVMRWLRTRLPTTQTFFSVCTGAFVLGALNLLDHRSATTFHLSLADLRAQYPSVDVQQNVRFVDNGNLITTAGISASIDGALHLVARVKGEEAAKRIAAMVEYDKWEPRQGKIIAVH